MQRLNEYNQPISFSVEDWKPVQKPSMTLTKGNYCILEALNIEIHAELLFETLKIDNRGESWTYLPYGPFDTCADFCEWLKITNSQDDTLLYAILDLKTQQPLGIAGYLRINPEHGVIEIGHLHFSKLLQRTPIATEAIYLMMKHVFNDLGYRRYEWKCNSLNQASCNAAKRFGFTFEGIFRQSNVFKGQNRDTAWFSIIDNEWPAIKNRFEKWLNPNNFDSYGNQIKKLREISDPETER